MMKEENAELTTVQAAAILNVSRPYLIRLLTEGGLPHRKVGKHRRLLMEDVMAYKNRIDQEREAALDQLAIRRRTIHLGREVGRGDPGARRPGQQPASAGHGGRGWRGRYDGAVILSFAVYLMGREHHAQHHRPAAEALERPKRREEESVIVN